VASGILAHRREGARAYFKAETQSPVFRELQQLFEKTAGLAPTLEQMLTKAVWEQDSECLYIWFRGAKPGPCDE
jgi:hypothetical protein